MDITEVFEAWRAWDLEMEPPLKKERRLKFESCIDLFHKATGSKAPRWAFRFYHRDEYARWRVLNPIDI